MSFTPDGSARRAFGDPLLAGRFPADLVDRLRASEIDESILALAHEIARHELARDHTLTLLAVLAAMEGGSTIVPLDALVPSLIALGVPEDRARRAHEDARAHDAVIGRPGEHRPLILHGDMLSPHAAY